MILYHGSNLSIEKIDLTKSKVGKDFGCGFYLTQDKDQALRMATKKTLILGSGFPTINKYEFDESIIESEALSSLRFESYTKEWAEFILMNRKNHSNNPSHPYDIVIGPVANDTVGFQIRRFTEGIIDMQRFIQELKYMKGMSIQYFFGTEKAISHLKKL